MGKLSPISGPNAIQLDQYLNLIVEPTFADFNKNRRSERHAYLAAVVTFHAIDRATFPKSSANLRKMWRTHSLEFLIVDIVANHFKHVKSDTERPLPAGKKGIPLSAAVFGYSGANVEEGSASMAVRNLYFLIRDAIKFIRQQIIVARV